MNSNKVIRKIIGKKTTRRQDNFSNFNTTSDNERLEGRKKIGSNSVLKKGIFVTPHPKSLANNYEVTVEKYHGTEGRAIESYDIDKNNLNALLINLKKKHNVERIIYY